MDYFLGQGGHPGCIDGDYWFATSKVEELSCELDYTIPFWL